jgi:hypothetical protein
MKRYSDFLFARPSFLEGVARVLDLGSTLERRRKYATPEEADWAAIASDWRVVGDDLRAAIATVANRPERTCSRLPRRSG